MSLGVNYEDIMRYFSQRTQFPYVLGSRLMKVKHLFNVQVVKKPNSVVEFFALCLQGSSISPPMRNFNK